jgi:flagellar FliL protein
MPQVRNRLLLLLSSKKASEILSVEGKKTLSNEIVAQIKQPFVAQGPQQSVSDVFFTSFVVQ